MLVENSFLKSHKGGLFCAMAVAFAVLATYPALDMGTADDWSYARSALDLTRTGHILYNGWATAMVGWQIFWGALIIKVFGFSFLALRLSTLPLAMGGAYLLYEIYVLLGLKPSNAILGTLTLFLSPVVLPLTTTFMTDVPGLLFSLLCLYACVRALMAADDRRSIAWLVFAVVTNVIGGTARQIVWLGALMTVPCTAWLLRKRRRVPSTVAALWVSSFVAILACGYWFQHQPYSLPERLLPGAVTFSLLPHLMQQVRDFFLTLLLFSLPVLVAYFTALRSVSRKLLLALFGLALMVMLYRLQTKGVHALAPWLPGSVTEYGVGGSGVMESLGEKPVILPPAIRFLLTLIVIAAASACCAALFSRSRSSEFRSTEFRSTEFRLLQTFSARALLILLGPSTLAYVLLLIPRAAFTNIWDRYTFLPLAIFIFGLLRCFEMRIRPLAPALSFATLGLFALYAIATTHDYFATGRARLEAASLPQNSGVPRTEVQGGFEYDGWTQLQSTGYINDPRLTIPRGAYHAAGVLDDLPKGCRFAFSDHTPAVHPQYFVVFSKQPCLAGSQFGPVSYRAWLPPFRRNIYVQALPNTHASVARPTAATAEHRSGD